MDKLFQVIFGLLDQDGKLKLLDFIFGEGNVPISWGDVHVLGAGDFFAVFDQ